MKTTFMNVSGRVIDVLAVLLGISSCQNLQSEMTLEQEGDSLTAIHIINLTRCLLLPIEEQTPEAQVCAAPDSVPVEIDMRLSRMRVDYFVPYALPEGEKEVAVRIRHLPKDALCWEKLKLPDTLDTTDMDKYCPAYHHTPLYGWMNDANGLVYKDSEHHLFYQYNPYGSMWGNMHRGYPVGKDLVHWEHLEPVLARDTLGHISPGSSVVNNANIVGYGAGTIVSFYTSASDKNGQIQCMAYSTDNGRTLIKYEKDPILTPFDGLKNFHGPKVFWHAPDQKWVMVISTGKEMRFYPSLNLKDWTYMSGWGESYGAQPSQFERPDMVELPVDGDPNRKKQALIVNVNPGYYLGGSATQYFTSDLDDEKFVYDNESETAKWLDWGKDHYATVCFSNTSDRAIVVPWTSGWQYANIALIRQFRSANALPRELSPYTQNGDIYMAAAPVEETKSLRKESQEIPVFEVADAYHVDLLLADNRRAHEIELELAAGSAEIMGLELFNERGENVNIYINLPGKKLVMDRTKSGIVDFGKDSAFHAIEAHDRRKQNSTNYVDDFALGTWAPVKKADSYKPDIFVDRCLVEIFPNGGEIVMTNLVLPTIPHNQMSFHSRGGAFKVSQCKVYRL